MRPPRRQLKNLKLSKKLFVTRCLLARLLGQADICEIFNWPQNHRFFIGVNFATASTF